MIKYENLVVYLDKKIPCLRFHSIWNTVLHAYFVLHNSTEKNVVQNLFFTIYLLPTRLFGLHVYSVP